MRRLALNAARLDRGFRAVMRALGDELARLNRFAIEDGAPVSRRERARQVATELARRYRGPNRCC
jgi:broad specificity phosphatase PhoE